MTTPDQITEQLLRQAVTGPLRVASLAWTALTLRQALADVAPDLVDPALLRAHAEHQADTGHYGLARAAALTAGHDPDQWAETEPTTVVLCGSMRYWEQMLAREREETQAGRIVLKPIRTCRPTTPDERVRLGALHLARIRAADHVVIVGSHVGVSTRAEIAYARRLGKPIEFTDPEADPDGH
ncbi:hypothetical protein ACN20G_36920 (plasmid) [Streptomyces sp. BI20]|uniref:hypothetical protein n=1 Tax=Streptomyces sp. BI20 TaxID=3403460 RepID=UPI003C7143B6